MITGLSVGRRRCVLSAVGVGLLAVVGAGGVGGARVAAPPAELVGEVIRIRDGDTLELLPADRLPVTVRLAGIDAPEAKQAYGQAARRELAALVFGREVRVTWKKKDDYGRVVGVVRVDGVDVNLRMIERGYAWHYKRFAGEQSTTDRRAYAAAEDEARAQRRGLWADPGPVAPWDFRHGVRALSAD